MRRRICFSRCAAFMGDQWNQIIAWMDEDSFPEHARLREEEWGQRDLRTSLNYALNSNMIFERFLASKQRASEIADQSIAR